jgi:hypothetical protein
VSLPYLVALFVVVFVGSGRSQVELGVSVHEKPSPCMSIKSCDVAKTLLSCTSFRLASELSVIMLKSPKLVRLADFYLRQHKKGFLLLSASTDFSTQNLVSFCFYSFSSCVCEKERNICRVLFFPEQNKQKGNLVSPSGTRRIELFHSDTQINGF